MERIKPRIYREMPMPEWKNSRFERWSRRWVADNIWRVRHIIGDFDDGMQECAKVFVEVLNKYGEAVESYTRFMGIYRKAVRHHWITIIIENKCPLDQASLEWDHKHYINSAVNYSEGPLRVCLGELSKNASTHLMLLMNAWSVQVTWKHVPTAAKAEILSTLFCHGNLGNNEPDRVVNLPAI